MTTRIKIENISDGGAHDLVVNVVETASPQQEGKNVERHDLKPGESVTVYVYGWQRYINILEASVSPLRASIAIARS